MLLLRTKWDWRRVRGHDPHALMLDPINWRHCSAVYRPFLLRSGALHQDVWGNEAPPSCSSQYAQVSTNHVTRHEPTPTPGLARRGSPIEFRDTATAEMTCFCCLFNLTDIRLLTHNGKHIYHLMASLVIFFILSDSPGVWILYANVSTHSVPSARRCKREYPAWTAYEDETHRVFRKVGTKNFRRQWKWKILILPKKSGSFG